MHLTIFRNRKRADIDAAAYQADAARMEALARKQPGFLSFKSFVADDGEVVALSEWDSGEAARAWGLNRDHAAVQARGQAAYYDEYTLFSCENPAVRHYGKDRA